MTLRPTLLAAVVLLSAPARSAAQAGTGAAPQIAPQAAKPSGEWRGARWGMSVEEVLKAFPGEAARLEPALQLADGNSVAAGIERQELGGQTFRVRFVFSGGKLALVSLVAGHERFLGAESFEALGKLLAERFGRAGELSRDDAFVDTRQLRWDLPRGRVDLKFIPGRLVILHSRPEARAAGKQQGSEGPGPERP